MLGKHWKKVILESELSVFRCGRVKPCFVKALGLCKGKRRGIEVFLHRRLEGVKKFTPLRVRCRFDSPQRAGVSV